MTGYNLKLDSELRAELRRIGKQEGRRMGPQILWFLREAVARYQRSEQREQSKKKGLE